jgi:hypothetical protein
MWELWWTNGHWGRFSPSTSVNPANSHSTDFFTLIIIYHAGLEWETKDIVGKTRKAFVGGT